MSDLDGIIEKSFVRDRFRDELIKQTPKVVVKEKQYGGKITYYLTNLGRIRFGNPFQKGEGRWISFINTQTFRDGIVRLASKALCDKIDDIDMRLKALHDERRRILADEFLRQDLIAFKDGRATMEQIRKEVEAKYP